MSEKLIPNQSNEKKQTNLFNQIETPYKVNDILNDDYEELLLDLLYKNNLKPLNIEEFKGEFQKKIKFDFWLLWYLKLTIIWNSLNIDMISMPKNWHKAMLFIIEYALENWITYINWEANPQKKISKDLERRLDILVKFYVSFWFFPTEKYSHSWWRYISWNIEDKELLKVLYKKSLVFFKTDKWPWIKR